MSGGITVAADGTYALQKLKGALPRRDAARIDPVPLCVDLDGTLLRTDLLAEGLVGLLATGRLHHAVAAYAAGGRAALKIRVADLTAIDPSILPYNRDFLDYLADQAASGRRLVLATAADSSVAHAIADYLGVFDEVLASDGVRNLKGAAKARALTERFGEGGFDYAGNDASDLEVWRHARRIVVVNAPARVRGAAQELGTVAAVFDDRPSKPHAILRAMRPHQWAKNILVFVPMVTAHALTEGAAWAGSIAMFLAFCLAASGIYVFNDLSDLAADRRHPRKRNRPFASGDLPVRDGIALGAGLMAGGLVLAYLCGGLGVLLVYIVASTAYSFVLKEKPLVDIFMLAGLYTIRIIGGGVASGHSVSLWLLAFSGFLFLSLALIKRVEEMSSVARSDGARSAGRRGYFPGDVHVLQSFGCSATFASAVVLALFVGSATASASYRAPEMLWAIVPLILFWQCRLWLATARGHMHDDPLVYASRDWVSWLVGACVLAVLLAAASGTPSIAAFIG
jgi:4-hydroxybenzoate polyprenyltransferase/phosphoserine phosphatase